MSEVVHLTAAELDLLMEGLDKIETDMAVLNTPPLELAREAISQLMISDNVPGDVKSQVMDDMKSIEEGFSRHLKDNIDEAKFKKERIIRLKGKVLTMKDRDQSNRLLKDMKNKPEGQ